MEARVSNPTGGGGEHGEEGETHGRSRVSGETERRLAGIGDRFALLLELSRAFNAQLELDELLPLVLSRTKQVLGAQGSSILLLDRDSQELFFPVTSSVSAAIGERLRSVRFPCDRGVAGWVLRSGRAVLVPEVGEDERFNPDVDVVTGLRTQDLLCAPLRTPRGVIGVIEVLNRFEGSFSEEDLEFLDTLAGSIAIAIDNSRLYEALRRSEAQLIQEVDVLRRERVHREPFLGITGTSPALQRVFSLMESAIPSPITVLLEGETGVGKEVIASAIHYNGPRKDRPFVTVNCGALPEALLEGELFGFRRGAFTGATADKQGLFEVADGGTLFLDEIGDTTPAMQVKLLRALQEGEIRRVGETRTRTVDVRAISATNRDLLEEVRAGRFREDLYYRISVFPIRVPPLRERKEDIPLLIAEFLAGSAKRLGKRIPKIAPQALDQLCRYSWPGNVRELQNEIERAVALAPDAGSIGVETLSDRVQAPSALSVSVPASGGTLKEARAAFEMQYVKEVLRENQGNATKAAQVLGISRQMLQRKIKEWRLR